MITLRAVNHGALRQLAHGFKAGQLDPRSEEFANSETGDQREEDEDVEAHNQEHDEDTRCVHEHLKEHKQESGAHRDLDSQLRDALALARQK